MTYSNIEYFSLVIIFLSAMFEFCSFCCKVVCCIVASPVEELFDKSEDMLSTRNPNEKNLNENTSPLTDGQLPSIKTTQPSSPWQP